MDGVKYNGLDQLELIRINQDTSGNVSSSTTFLDLPATANHTRDGKVITASGSVRTNPVQVYDFQQGDTGRGVDQFGNFTVGCLATLYIRIPAGRLEL